MVCLISILFSGIFPAVVKADTGYSIDTEILTSIPRVTEPVDVKVSVLENGIPLSDKNVELQVTYPDSSTQILTCVTDSSGIALFSFIASTKAEDHNLRINVSNNILTRSIPVQASDPESIYLAYSRKLVQANGISTALITAIVEDKYQNRNKSTVLGVDTSSGIHLEGVTDEFGTLSFNAGPGASSYIENIQVSTKSSPVTISNSTQVWFVDGDLTLERSAEIIVANSSVTITGTLTNGGSIFTGVPVYYEFYLYRPGQNNSIPYYVVSDTGVASVTLNASTSIGTNYVMCKVRDLDLFRMTTFQVMSSSPTNLTVFTIPSDPVFADGVSTYKIMAQLSDEFGNRAPSGILINFSNPYGEVWSVPTNKFGTAEITSSPSSYPGEVLINVSTINNLTKSISLQYIVGPPCKVYLRAIPNVVASSEVLNDESFKNIHATNVTAIVTDEWYHPLPGQYVELTVPTGNGLISEPSSGTTNQFGEFRSVFTLDNNSFYFGEATVKAESNGMMATANIIYTNRSFLSVSTEVEPRIAAVNKSVNVTINITGIGWKVAPKPVDAMLVIDTSSSMDWYADLDRQGELPKTGWIPDDKKWYKIGEYTMTQRPKSIDFMCGWRYNNQGLSGSQTTYYDLLVQYPNGNNYTCTSGLTERIHVVNDAKNMPLGTYQLYARYQNGTIAPPSPYFLSVELNTKRIKAAKDASKDFVETVSPLDRVGLVSYNSNSQLRYPLTPMSGDRSGLISSINGMSLGGGTYTHLGLSRAIDHLLSTTNDDVKKVIILLTDGYSYYPDNDRAQALRARDNGIILYTVGFGGCDEEQLSYLANVTGGKYYRASNSSDLSERFKFIATDMHDTIAQSSELTLLGERSEINGTVINNAEYVSGSAIVTATNGTKYQKDPTITFNDSSYTLKWNPGVIRVNEIWSVKYQLLIKKGGYIYPIGNGSQISFLRPDDSIGTSEIGYEVIYASDNLTAGLNADDRIINITIISPGNNSRIRNDLTEVVWLVRYNDTGNYTQVIDFAPDTTGIFNVISTGFQGNMSNNNTPFKEYWNVRDLPFGNYLLRISASDGNSTDSTFIVVNRPDMRGQIILE
ncbi:VWA domain-containing protein [Methanooceanicella nereidis]|uniref:VWA domain-containing protein n=1 Tax=Methanooceanicella nereidis TaxID=2052831 RepID=UPI001E28E1F1